jgi:3-oxoadipate enol-lactonase
MPHVTAADGAELYYTVDSGARPWVKDPETILLHHGIALDADFWFDWVPTLTAAGYRVVRLDMRGYGRSHVPAAGYAWSMDGFIADVESVMKAVGAERIHYVGESMGGTIGLAMAVKHPEQLRTVTGVSTAHMGNRIQGGLTEWRRVIEGEGMVAWSTMMNPESTDPELYRWFDQIQGSCAPHIVMEQSEFLQVQDLTDDLQKIQAPLLLLTPESSPFVTQAVSRHLHQAVVGSELQVFGGDRHALVNSRAKECAAALVAFLRRQVA